MIKLSDKFVRFHMYEEQTGYRKIAAHHQQLNLVF